MLSLIDSCSLDISIDLDSNRLVCGENVKHNGCNRVKLQSIQPSLLNKSLSYPEDVYDVYQKICNIDDSVIDQTDISYDVILLPTGLLGVEYVKTHIYYTPETDDTQTSCFVEVQYGVLTVIMQKNQPKKDIYDFETHVDEASLVRLYKGERMSIPQGYYYTFINTEETPTIFVRLHRREGIADYNMLKRERGMAYYCIRKNAKQEIVLNPAYRNTPKINMCGAQEVNENECTIPLYQLLKQQLDTVVNTLWA
jgi:oxalate decarboxylase/phosphoglucose isomerase-like protein (cupin superfamily)